MRISNYTAAHLRYVMEQRHTRGDVARAKGMTRSGRKTGREPVLCDNVRQTRTHIMSRVAFFSTIPTRPKQRARSIFQEAGHRPGACITLTAKDFPLTIEAIENGEI